MSKKLPYKITDIEALKVAYPQIVTEHHVVLHDVDKALLYQIVKVNYALKIETPGVSLVVANA